MLSEIKKKHSKPKFKFWSQHVSFAQQITFLFTGIFTLGLLLSSAFVLLNVKYFYKAVPEGELNQTLNELSAYIEQGKEVTADALEEINPNRFVEIVIINTKTNEIITNMPPKRPPPELGINTEASDPSPLNVGFGEFRPQNITHKVNPNVYHKEKLIKYNDETYRVILFRRVSQEQYYTSAVSRLLIAINILGLIAAYATAKYLSKRLINPIKTIRMAAEKITIEDLSQRIEITGPNDELKELSITFNAMIDRLETSFKKQNQFISDASHELRTPISVIQGYANLISRWGKSDPEVLQESIDSIKAETEHMTTLIKKLLFIARQEQNKKQIQITDISLNQICADAVKECAIMEISNPIKLIEKAEVTVNADLSLIKQLLWIFIENSVKYSKNNEEISIILSKDEKNAYLTVKDNGIGIDESEIPFIFDRFYRVDKSRNKKIEGTGLGLSIAKWIVDQFDGEIKVESRVGAGCEMTVVFKNIIL